MMKNKHLHSASVHVARAKPAWFLMWPLAFGVLVWMIGMLARHLMDRGGVVSMVDGGTLGMLVWITAPALLAWLFGRLDVGVQLEHPFAWQRQALRLSCVVAVVAMCVMWCVIKLGLAMGGLVIDHSMTPLPMQTRVLDLVGVVCFAFLEEAAWRGYLMPALLARFRYLVVWLVGAVIWFAWHLPYLDVLSANYTSESTDTLAPRLWVGVLAMQFLYIELFLICRSVWPAVVLHAALNGMTQANLATGLTLNRTHTWTFSPSADGLPIMLLCTAAGLLLYWMRMSRNPLKTSKKVARTQQN